MKENTLEERFNKAWKFGVDDTQKKANMKAFIEAEKELSRQEGLDEGLATANKGKLYEIVVEKAKQEAYKEVVKMAEEMEGRENIFRF